MPRLSLQSALGAAVLIVSPLACALGFGPTSTPTTLGQHLNFAASVMLDPEETLSRDCVFADVYSGDAKVAPRHVRAVLEATRDASQRIVRVTTAVAIDEPIVTIEVSVGCGSRVSRRFVAFIDPPSLQLAESGGSETLPLPARDVDAQSASLADIARQADASRRQIGGAAAAGDSEHAPRGARHAPRGPQRMAVASAASTAPPRTHHAHASARTKRGAARTALLAPPRSVGARLRLEAPRLLAVAPSASAASAATPLPVVSAPAIALPTLPVDAALALAPPPAAAASDAPTEAQQRERIQLLEAGLANVRADAQATQQTVAALQARLRQAEGERYRNGLVYALVGTTLLGVLLAVGLWLLRPRQRRRARWFDAQAGQQARAGRVEKRPAPPVAPVSSIPAPSHADSGQDWSDHPANALSTRPATIGGLEVTTVLGPEMSRPVFEASTTSSGAVAGPRKNIELTMEELIDLEQQAEFFVVLGQDEAAIALLDGYMQGVGGKSPLPYLQLLEIHQRRGEQAAYDRVRRIFNERFNANAPDWSSALHLGRALDAYPQTVARLQSLWSTPLSAMQTLDNLLFRRQAAEETFDFPAYRELLFLYSIARELSGSVETDFGSIDLFLPLEGATAEALDEAEEESQDDVDTAAGRLSVDLDVSNWPEDATMSDLLMRRNPARRSAG
jgi:pilus assembly protein FimV